MEMQAEQITESAQYVRTYSELPSTISTMEMQAEQITEIAPYVRTYFWVALYYKYHGGAVNASSSFYLILTQTIFRQI